MFNPSQSDLNEDGEGDACQSGDLDNDGIPDDGGDEACPDGVTLDCDDNCPNNFNPSQSDVSGDQIGDVCQPSDSDGDGVPDDGGPATCPDGVTLLCDDNCPYYPNTNQSDVDGDGKGDALRQRYRRRRSRRHHRQLSFR